MRRRDEWFVRKVIARLATGSDLDDETLIASAREAWRFGHIMDEEKKRRHALARARDALLNPDIQARFVELFELSGFDVNDATAKHIEHIRSGNYAALRDYWNMTQPKAPRQIDIRQAVVHVDPREPKAMIARPLPAIESVESEEA